MVSFAWIGIGVTCAFVGDELQRSRWRHEAAMAEMESLLRKLYAKERR